MKCPNCGKTAQIGWAFCAKCGAALPAVAAPTSHKPRVRGNGEGSVYKDSRTGLWVAQKYCGRALDHDTGRSVALYARKYGFATKRDALAALPELQRKEQAKKEAPVTVKAVYDAWRENYLRRNRKEHTLRGYDWAMAYFADLADVPFRDVGIDDWQDAIDECPKGKRTRQLMRGCVSQMYKHAIPRRWTVDDTNPAPYLFCDGPSGKAKVRFSSEELDLLQGAVGRVPMAEYVLAACYLGYRPGEFVALDCSNYHADERYFIAGAKTEAGKNRCMTISPKIQPYIDAAVAGRSEGPVWRGKDGERMTYDQWRRAFNGVLSALGIPVSGAPAPDGRYLTPHCCRHTARSLMDHAAGSERAKMALIGHASEEMSALYTHQELRDLREVTDSM